MIEEEQIGLLTQFSSLNALLSDASNKSKNMNVFRERVNSLYIDLKDILDDLVYKRETLESKPALLEKLTTFMRKNEPDAYDYGYYISPNGKKITLIEKYKSSKAAILHADNFENGQNMKPFLDMFKINSFILIGNSTEELKNRIKNYGVEPRVLIGGWTN